MGKKSSFTKIEKHGVITKVEQFLLLGYSIPQACEFANVEYGTFMSWTYKDHLLRARIAASANKVNCKARENLVKRIQKGDVGVSKYWLERRDPAFSEKVSEPTEADNEYKKLIEKMYGEL